MKARFFGSSKCKDCLKLFVLLNRYQIDYQYIDALNEDEEIQKLCDENNVMDLPHLQFFSDDDHIIIEHIGPITNEQFIEYLVNYFPNY